MNKQKAMLDALMGTHRDKSAKEKTGEEFTDETNCKHYLVGFCPDGLIGKQVQRDRNPMEVNDKMPVPCTKVHSAALKADFEKHPKSETFRRKYEESLLRRLEDIVFDVDKRVFLGKKKCEPKHTGLKLPDTKLQKLMEEYESERERYSKLAVSKGEAGDVTGAQDAMQQVEMFQKRIDLMIEQHTVDFPGEECCDVCATRYLLGPKRAYVHGQKDYSGYHSEQEHATDKTHHAYVEIREWFAKLKEKKLQQQLKDKKPKSRSRSRRSSDRKRAKSRSKSAGRKETRSRDRSRNNDKRSVDNSRKENSKRSRSRSRGDRRRSRDRGRDSNDRGRGQGRDRSRGRGGRRDNSGDRNFDKSRDHGRSGRRDSDGDRRQRGR